MEEKVVATEVKETVEVAAKVVGMVIVGGIWEVDIGNAVAEGLLTLPESPGRGNVCYILLQILE